MPECPHPRSFTRRHFSEDNLPPCSICEGVFMPITKVKVSHNGFLILFDEEGEELLEGNWIWEGGTNMPKHTVQKRTKNAKEKPAMKSKKGMKK